MIAIKRELNLITLTAFIFDIHEGAQKMLDLIEEISINDPITLEDLAMVTWEPGVKNPKTKQTNGPISNGALSGAFWGLLFSRIFFIPSFGMAVGAAMGSLDGKFAAYGISNRFSNSVGEQVSEGTLSLIHI